MKPIIVFDWDGTILKKEVAEEAALRRMHTLNISFTKEEMQEAQKTRSHYAIVKDTLKAYTGISDTKQLTILMTNLFQLHYLAVVQEKKQSALQEGILEVLETLQKTHRLMIASALREDIIVPSLQTLQIDPFFEKVCANTPDLAYSKEDLLLRLQKEYQTISWMIGDREEDILAGKKVQAKTIFCQYGQEEHKEPSDYSINEAKEIKKIISTYNGHL